MAAHGGVPDEEAMVRVAVANLADRFAIDAFDIETTVRRCIAEWIGRARVKTFVGIIAERHARLELQSKTLHEQTVA
jgi:hypothetical protein